MEVVGLLANISCNSSIAFFDDAEVLLGTIFVAAIPDNRSWFVASCLFNITVSYFWKAAVRRSFASNVSSVFLMKNYRFKNVFIFLAIIEKS